MIVFIVFVVALALPAVWLFARTRPATSRVDLLRRFNAVAWGIAAFAGSLAWIRLSGTSAQAVPSEGSSYFAVIGGVAIGSTVLLVAALVRLLVFRRLG